MKIRMSRTALTFAAAIAAAVTLTTTPALASTPAPAATSHSSVITPQSHYPPGITEHGVAQPATNCPWITNSGVIVPGTIICEYGDSSVIFPNGTEEDFAVGTSHAVWTAWDNLSGNWDTKSMGGPGAFSEVQILRTGGWNVEIAVNTSSNIRVCDNRGNSPSAGWSGWGSC